MLSRDVTEAQMKFLVKLIYSEVMYCTDSERDTRLDCQLGRTITA